MTDYAVNIENLDYSYSKGVYALEGINLKIKKNEFIGIIGENGAGKSTLLKSISGLLKPTGGDVFVLGVNTKEISVARLATKAGLIMQNPDRQLFCSSVYEEVSYGPKNLGLNDKEIKNRVESALSAVGLNSLFDDFPPALSKGNRAKVVIASVLAMRPEIVILDEPTSGQDYLGSYQIMDIAKKLHAAGFTIIMATHQMALVAEYVQRVIVMGKGKIMMDGVTRDVFSYPEKLLKTNITLPQITQLGFKVQRQFNIEQAILNTAEMRDKVMDFFKNEKQ